MADAVCTRFMIYVTNAVNYLPRQCDNTRLPFNRRRSTCECVYSVFSYTLVYLVFALVTLTLTWWPWPWYSEDVPAYRKWTF